VAVFDVETDEEIATGQGADGLNGIELNTTNPLALQYVESLNEIVVTGRGNIFGEFNDLEGDPFVGGIEVIDVASFENELLLDDGFRMSVVTSLPPKVFRTIPCVATTRQRVYWTMALWRVLKVWT